MQRYYDEGKGIRNRLTLALSAAERAAKGAEGTVPVLARVHKAIQTGRRKPKVKVADASQQPDLL